MVFGFGEECAGLVPGVIKKHYLYFWQVVKKNKGIIGVFDSKDNSPVLKERTQKKTFLLLLKIYYFSAYKEL